MFYAEMLSCIKECVTSLIGVYNNNGAVSLNAATLSCQNAACSDPICTKRKTVFKLTKFVKSTYQFC